MGTKEAEVAGAIVRHSQTGLIVVVNQNRDSWSLPKGHIDPGENAEQAARRETHEEAGVTQLKLIKELGSYKRYKIALGGGDDPSELKHIHMFLFETDQNELKPIDPHNPEARWVDKSEVAAMLTHRKDSEFFESVLPSF